MRWKNGSLQAGVHRLEDSILVLSGPALAISGIIAGVDLLTGGHLLQEMAWLSMTWAICLALSLDFQVLTMGVKAQAIWRSNKGGWQKAAEIALVVVIVAAISYVSIQMQSMISRSTSAGVSIDQAARDLGIDPVALIWERSTLVLLLIFLSGWSRHTGQSAEQGSVGSGLTPAQQGQPQEDLLVALLARLTPLQQVLFKQLGRLNQQLTRQLLDQLTLVNQQAIGSALAQMQEAMLAEIARQASYQQEEALEQMLHALDTRLERAFGQRVDAVLTRVEAVRVTLEDVAQNTAQFPTLAPVNPRRLSGPAQATQVTDRSTTAEHPGQRPRLASAPVNLNPLSDAGGQPGQVTVSATDQTSGVNLADRSNNSVGSLEKGQAVRAFITSYLLTQNALPGVKTVMTSVPCARNTARAYLRELQGQTN